MSLFQVRNMLSDAGRWDVIETDFISIGVWMTHPEFGDFPYDLNSWIESDQGRAVSAALAEDTVIFEGYPELETNRTYLANLRHDGGNPMEQVEIDAVGGVSILAKSEVFRAGCHFPAFSFQNQVETEAFGKVCFAQIQSKNANMIAAYKNDYRWQRPWAFRSEDYPITLFGMHTRKGFKIANRMAHVCYMVIYRDSFVHTLHIRSTKICPW